MAVEQSTRRRGAAPAENGPGPDPLAGRLGLSVPHEWWASAPLLKSYEAAGFAWVQLHAPPLSVLGVARLTTTHALAAAAALSTTSLRAVVHAPSSLRAGTREGDRAFEGVLSYAAEVGAAQVVYHALALPEGRASEPALVAEARSLERHARVAERLEVRIAIENLAPLFPGPESLSANPILLRGLVRRFGSPAIAICLDLGHAHIVGRPPQHLGRAALRAGARPGRRLPRPRQPRRAPPRLRREARRRPAAPRPAPAARARDAALGPDRVADQRPSRAADAEVHPPFRPRSAELATIVRSALS